METIQMPEIPDLSTNKFQQAEKEAEKETQQTPKPQPQPENNQVLIPPKQEENNELLIGVYLKKEQKTIDYYYNSEQIPLILFNKNVIIGMLENIKLDILIGENKPNE